MFALRTAARSGARLVPRLTSASSKTVGMTIGRPALKAAPAALASRIPAFANYSTDVATGGKNFDVELSEKLSKEIEYEKDLKADDMAPSIQEFTKAGIWEIKDEPGKDDVVLTRTLGDEKITVSFSIVDLANYDESEDPYFGEEGEEMEGDEPGMSESGEGEDGDMRPTPCRLHVVVEKPGKTKGALNIEATATADRINIDSVYYYGSATHAHSPSPEAEFAAQEMYPGPPFDTIDTDLQMLMERYIQERGIDASLSAFASDYMMWKEQKEYLSWLQNVKGFVEA